MRGMVAPHSHRILHHMTESTPTKARGRPAPAGYIFLAITSICWGFNWPVIKFLIGELPPLTLRGLTGVIGAALLALLALLRGQSLRVPGEIWPRLLLAALLNVTGWMVLMGLALLWLPASEAALVAYTMPVWAALLAWPVLGEQPTLLRVIALMLAFGGLAAIMGGNGITASQAKLPGILMALTGAFGFALGTVLAKRFPIHLPAVTAAAWQIGLGSIPTAIAGLAIETTHLDRVTYLCWFAALARLPASVAAIGTMAVPVIGVAASAVALHEPLGLGQLAALALTLGAVALATRS
jgi:drug/metabolite transporter (DMT)-like permease